MPYTLTAQQKEARVKISKGTLKLLKYGGHRIISKIASGDVIYIPFYDVTSCQESRIWFHKDDPATTVVKKQRAMKKVMYAVFLRCTDLVKVLKFEVTVKWYTSVCIPQVFKRVKVF